jgi:tetratricopeptide (TPR) repeat protein
MLWAIFLVLVGWGVTPFLHLRLEKFPQLPGWNYPWVWPLGWLLGGLAFLWKYGPGLSRRRVWVAQGPMLLLISGPVLFLILTYHLQDSNWLQYMMAGLGLALLLFWLGFPCWFSIWFRSTAYWVSRKLGVCLRWSSSAWRLPILFMGAVVLAQWARIYVLSHPGSDMVYGLKHFLVAEHATKTAIAAALLLIAYWVYQARRRIVILPFVDHTGDPELKDCVPGIATRLLNELFRISALYTNIDEARPDKIIQGDIVKATVNVENIGETLQQTVSADSKLSLGMFEIPVGTILSIVGRIVQGPQLTGSLHRGHEGPILIAQLSGGGQRGSWRVSIDKLRREFTSNDTDDTEDASGSSIKPLTGCGKTKLVNKMIEQLACRIFTDLGHIESPRWRAVSDYTAGLRLYRETLRTKGDSIVRLRKAEKAFIRALSEDNQYAHNHYNLGVVYRDLAKANKESEDGKLKKDTPFYKAAQAAFTKAVEEYPAFCSAYYALALNKYDLGENEDVVRLCKQVIALRPHDALAWNLMACAGREIFTKPYRNKDGSLKIELQLTEDACSPEYYEKVIDNCQIATALAWRTLCLAALKGKTGEKLTNKKDIARTCARNLAMSYSYKHVGRSKRIFQQALGLTPEDETVYYKLGRSLLRAKEYERAAAAFRSALEIKENPLFWGYLAKALADQFKRPSDKAKKDIEYACNRAANYGLRAQDKDLEPARDAWHKIHPYDQMGLMKLNPGCLSRLDKYKKKDEKGKEKDEDDQHYIIRLNEEVRDCDDGRSWFKAQASIRLAKQYLRKDRPTEEDEDIEKAKDLLQEAIETLKDDQPTLIREHDLYGDLAKVYMIKKDLATALYYAEHAVAIDPEGCLERVTLGEAYLNLKHYDRAEREWETALSLDPGLHTLERIASISCDKAKVLRNPAERRKTISYAIGLFKRALEIAESKSYDLSQADDRRQSCGRIHFRLAYFYYQLKEYDNAISHLKIVQAIGFSPLEVRVYLCQCYIEARAYNAADNACHDAMREAGKQYRQLKKKPPAKPIVSTKDWINALWSMHGDDLGESKPIDNLLIKTLHFQALSYAYRGIRLPMAKRLAEMARRRIDLVKDRMRRQKYEAMNHFCLGLIHFKGGDMPSAKTEFLGAIELYEHPNTYYRLAEACYEIYKESRGATSALAAPAYTPVTVITTRVSSDKLLKEARQYCKRAGEIDLEMRITSELDDLLRRIDAD